MRGELLISEWLYGTLLALYPKPFRATYSQPMRLTFRDACRVAYHQNGAGGLLVLWLPTLLDLFKSALEERARQGEFTMSKERMMTLAGPLTIIVGALWLLTAMGDFVFKTILAGEESFLGLMVLPFILSFIPLLFALIGTRLHFHPSAGILGRLGLALSVGGCAGVVLSLLASFLLSGSASEVNWVRYTAVICFLSIRIGYLLFGLDALRYRLLPRWNFLPLLLGSTVILSFGFDWFDVPAFLHSQWGTPFLHFALTGLCWVLLGITMLGQRRESLNMTASA